ncbi:MAG: OmpH family outer membrane protein, partial [Candidatus Margulisiibacteriota bacterium]
MRKYLVTALALVLMFGVAKAADFSGIGTIDVQKVFKGYKETGKSQAELAKLEEGFKKEFEDSQKTLAQAEKDGKKPEELEKMKKDLEEKLAPKREALMRLNEQLTTQLQSKILDAVKKVSKKVGIEVVLDKVVVINGGTDL